MPTYDLLGKHFPISGGTEFALIRSLTSPIALKKGDSCPPVSFQFIGSGRTAGTATGTSALLNVITPGGITTEWDYTALNFTIDFDPCSDDTVTVSLGTIYRRYYIPSWQYFPNYPDSTPYVEGSLEQITYAEVTAQIVRLADEGDRYAIPGGGLGSYIYPQLITEQTSWSQSGSKPYISFPEFQGPLYSRQFPRGCGATVMTGLRPDGTYDHTETGTLGGLSSDFTNPCIAWSRSIGTVHEPLARIEWAVNY